LFVSRGVGALNSCSFAAKSLPSLAFQGKIMLQFSQEHMRRSTERHEKIMARFMADGTACRSCLVVVTSMLTCSNSWNVTRRQGYTRSTFFACRDKSDSFIFALENSQVLRFYAVLDDVLDLDGFKDSFCLENAPVGCTVENPTAL